MGLLRGMPQFPDETLEPKLYNALLVLQLAIGNLDDAYGTFTGAQPYPADQWPLLNYTDSYTVGAMSRMYFKAGVAITAGHVVNIYDDGADRRVRKAKADGDLDMAHGIANNSAAIGAWVEVLGFRGVTTLIGGLTPGLPYYLSPTTAGVIQNTRPTTAGQIIQCIGIALTSSKLLVDISTTVIIL